jgi:ketosteroid isomerase-like protein
MADLTQVAADLIDAFNEADWERFRAVLSPDAVYAETGTGRRVEGADAYVQLCQGWKDAREHGRAGDPVGRHAHGSYADARRDARAVGRADQGRRVSVGPVRG